jgi:hypothetical protein
MRDFDALSKHDLFEGSRLIMRAANGVLMAERMARPMPRGKRQRSILRAIEAAARGRYEIGAPAEHEAWGMVDGNPQRFVIPWEEFGVVSGEQRDLTAANFGAGGATKSTMVTPLTLPLQGADVVDAGANVILNVSQDSVNPAVTTKPTFAWQGTENTALTNDTAMVLGLIASTPKRGGISLLVSHQLNVQAVADQTGSLVERLLIQCAGEGASLAVLNGSGAAGQPTGILSTAGVPNVSGTSLNMPALAEAEADCCAADADDSRLTIFCDPPTRRKLRAREIATGSGSVWPGRDLLGHRAFVTSRMPANTLLMGDFSNVDILLFGRGIEVLVNPFADFKSGRIEMEVAVSMDVRVHYPTSFTKITSIT